MSEIVKINIDGLECLAYRDQYVIDAARENGIYIPSLCNYPGVIPRASCRICSVRINGRMMTACTTRVSDGMKIENNTPELNQKRKTIIEVLFVEGNHFCPICEKSGRCELQALAYRYQIMVPQFEFIFPRRDIEATHPKLMKDHNRCILCKRCIRGIKNKEGKSLFAFGKRGRHLTINIDTEYAKKISDELAQKAMDICPVGAILKKEKGFDIPIGRRLYDHEPIGSEIEKLRNK